MIFPSCRGLVEPVDGAGCAARIDDYVEEQLWFASPE
jgi:hypothetical protein